MKTVLVVSIMTILVTGVVVPALHNAYAYPLKADNSEKLKPKSFGVKTKDKILSDNSGIIKQNNFESIKKEQVKTFKKIVAEYNAKQILKSIYNLG